MTRKKRLVATHFGTVPRHVDLCVWFVQVKRVTGSTKLIAHMSHVLNHASNVPSFAPLGAYCHGTQYILKSGNIL